MCSQIEKLYLFNVSEKINALISLDYNENVLAAFTKSGTSGKEPA